MTEETELVRKFVGELSEFMSVVYEEGMIPQRHKNNYALLMGEYVALLDIEVQKMKKLRKSGIRFELVGEEETKGRLEVTQGGDEDQFYYSLRLETVVDRNCNVLVRHETDTLLSLDSFRFGRRSVTPKNVVINRDALVFERLDQNLNRIRTKILSL